MKRFILAVFVLSAVISLGAYISRTKPTSPPRTEGQAEATPAPAADLRQIPDPARVRPTPAPSSLEATTDPAPAATVAPSGRSSNVSDTLALQRNLETLLSPEASHADKQAAWRQLRESGKIDVAIGELEQRVAANPRSADFSSLLGQAYLQKCATIQDVREQGVLALQADKLFETALSLDPSNWDARFTKAVAMSYWPPNMNKGQEVIENFQTLIQQQETQAPQPHFAETYAWLGDQYQKAGQADAARAVWQRGAALFPNDGGLQKKLAVQ